MKRRYRAFLGVLLACVLLLAGCGSNQQANTVLTGTPQQTATDALAKVHFLDVGQGDCILIQLDGKTMLIDAAEADQAEKIVSYLEAQGIQKLDYVLGTHPHADHIGGLRAVIEQFEIGEIYLPKVTHTTTTYQKLLQATQDKGQKVHTAKAGITVCQGDGYKAEMLSPQKDTYEDVNNTSIVLKLTVGDTAFLFTGDAEAEVEKDLNGVQADVLKVGHHGSRTSSSAAFLQRVQPKIAVISCGKDNEYGHPHKETLQSLAAVGATVYRTDQNGTILCTSDGKTVTVTTQLQTTPTPTDQAADGQQTVYVTKTGKRYHADGCSGLKNSGIPMTLEQAKEKGYTPHEACHPPQ